MSTSANWFHLSMKSVSRSAGRSVVAAAAYRLGARIEDERVQLVHDYRARSGVEAVFTVAPASAPLWAMEPERLWNAAEAAERRVNSTLARELELALPNAVDATARLVITEAIAAELVARYGVAVSVAVHLPSAEGDQRNHHAHILFTTREMTPAGLGNKTRILDDRKTGPQEVHYLRAFACDLINDALADAGSDERVDHRSFKTRGIDQEPTSHLGPTATEIERRGRTSELGEENRAVEKRNAQRSEIDDLVDELAALDAAIQQALNEEFVTHDPAECPPEQGDEVSLIVPAPLSDFDAIHAETLRAAQEEHCSMEREDARDRFDRFERWWQNLIEHFVEWRDQLIERATQIGLRWFGGEEGRGGPDDKGHDHE